MSKSPLAVAVLAVALVAAPAARAALPCDSDGDLVCDAVDVCPSVPDPLQLDSDGDGYGDACDPCTGGGGIAKTKVKIASLSTPPGDDLFRARGILTGVPQSSLLDPGRDGARIRLLDALGRVVVDANLPAGPYVPALRRGWKTGNSGTRFLYRDRGAAPLAGLVKVGFTLESASPGVVRFKIEGKRADYRVRADGLPLRLALILDPPVATNGRCGEESFGDAPSGNPERCLFLPSGSGVLCQ